MQETYLGIEIGGTKLQFALGDGAAVPLQQWRWPVEREKGAPGICRQMEATLPEIIRRHAPVAVGVGFGGPVDRADGRISCSHQVTGWSGFQLTQWLGALTGLPVTVDNDANVAALGEAHRGAGRGFNPVFYITLGSGVGGGLVVDQQIYHGASSGESEFGHLLLDHDGHDIESCCSGWAIDAKTREYAQQNQADALGRLVRQHEGKGGEAKCLKAALEEGDPAAKQILADLGRDLAFGLSHVVHLCHPEIIILGGGLSLLGEPLRAAVAEALPGHIMSAFSPGPRITLAGLGEAVVPVGAIELARAAVPRQSRSNTVTHQMKDRIAEYINAQKAALESIPAAAVGKLIQQFARALREDRQIFVAGNGGSAANASHFATDLGKGASDKLGSRFRVLSLADNVSWLTALGNDYTYDDIFVRQLQNFAKAGDLLLVMSVSGNSPNLVKAVEWAEANKLATIALVGEKRGRLAELAQSVVVVDSGHYGRVEDAHMGICHMLCYAFMENPGISERED